VLDKGGEGQGNYFSKKKSLERVFLDIEPDWQKIILIIFCPTTKAVRLLALLLLPFETKQQAQTPVVSTQNTPDSGREKKAIDVQQSKSCCTTPPAPVHVSLCHVAFPFPLCNADLSS
jgi:hypothetical protein